MGSDDECFKGNKGMWSEPYVLFELLSQGRIYKSDANQNIIKSVWHDIRSIIFRIDKNDKGEFGSLKYELTVNENNERRITLYNGNNPPVAIELNDCKKYADGLRNILSNPKAEIEGSKGTLVIPAEYSEFIHKIGRKALSTGSKSKSDIWLELPDVRNTTDRPLGFSIKSDFGSAPSIFNSSNSSNIVYKVTGSITDKEEKEINSLVKIHNNSKTKEKNYYPDYVERIKYFKKHNLDLEFFHEINNHIVKGPFVEGIRLDTSELCGSYTFERNLKMVDSQMHFLFGKMAYYVHFKGITKLTEIVKLLDEEDPLNINPDEEYPFYKKKIQDLLVAMTLSMNPGSIWDGSESTNGGIIIVKKTGDIVCYHIFDRNDFRDFLLENMHFDKPDCNRYHMMALYRQEDGSYLTQLNVQIRM